MVYLKNFRKEYDILYICEKKNYLRMSVLLWILLSMISNKIFSEIVIFVDLLLTIAIFTFVDKTNYCSDVLL